MVALSRRRLYPGPPNLTSHPRLPLLPHSAAFCLPRLSYCAPAPAAVTLRGGASRPAARDRSRLRPLLGHQTRGERVKTRAGAEGVAFNGLHRGASSPGVRRPAPQDCLPPFHPSCGSLYERCGSFARRTVPCPRRPLPLPISVVQTTVEAARLRRRLDDARAAGGAGRNRVELKRHERESGRPRCVPRRQKPRLSGAF